MTLIRRKRKFVQSQIQPKIIIKWQLVHSTSKKAMNSFFDKFQHYFIGTKKKIKEKKEKSLFVCRGKKGKKEKMFTCIACSKQGGDEGGEEGGGARGSGTPSTKEAVKSLTAQVPYPTPSLALSLSISLYISMSITVCLRSQSFLFQYLFPHL